MKRMTVLAAVFLALAPAPVFAQVPDVPPEIPNTVSGAAAAPRSLSLSGCQSTIDEATSMIGALPGGLKASALSELNQAKAFLAQGNTSACMTHAKAAMGMMK